MTQTLRQVEYEKGREGREGDGKVRVCVWKGDLISWGKVKQGSTGRVRWNTKRVELW